MDPEGDAWRPIYHIINGEPLGYEWVNEEFAYDKEGKLREGLYHQAIFFSDNGTFNKYSGNNIGSSTATIFSVDGTITTFMACTKPSDEVKYATVPEGVYEAKPGNHKGYLALRMANVGTVNFLENKVQLDKPNPAHPNNYFIQGANIHKSGEKGLTGFTSDGRPISMACLVINYDDWSNFISFFDKDEQKNDIISVILSRTRVKPIVHFTEVSKITFKSK